VLELESSLCIYIIASSCGRSNYTYVHARVTNKKVQMVGMDYRTVDSSQVAMEENGHRTGILAYLKQKIAQQSRNNFLCEWSELWVHTDS